MSNTQSKFTKQVLFSEGEYERLRQRQFREYSPELQIMVRLHEEIVSNLKRHDLTPQEKVDLISSLQ